MTVKLLACSSTFDGIMGLASDYYDGSRTLVATASPDGGSFSLANANGSIQGVRIVHKHGRWRFERLDNER
jgi:hypothetical protein